MIKGINNGAVLQRGKDGTCETFISVSDNERLFTTSGVLKRFGKKWKLTGIPVGGPYDFRIYSRTESIDLRNIYVGDLWLLGGQSNMEGAGVVTERDEYYRTHTNDNIRAFYMEDEWRPAVPLLHRPWKSKDKCIVDFWKGARKGSAWEEYDKNDGEYPYEDYRGVGPGFAFALKMYEITGVPQGVIPCAVGGSSLKEWYPYTDSENYYTAMIRRLDECGGNAKGLYWDQGEAECCSDGIISYTDKTKQIVDSVRKVNGEELFVVFNQIAYNRLWNDHKENNYFWSGIREKQRFLPTMIDNCDVVSTINATLSDLIHKDSNSQYEIGRAAAISMANLCGYGGNPSIKFKGFKISKNDTVPFRYDLDVYYENVIENLTSEGAVSGFTIQLSGEDSCFYPYKHIQNVQTLGNKVRIRNELKYDEILNADIWYGIGNNCLCTVIDGEKRSIPAMGPVKVRDNLL